MEIIILPQQRKLMETVKQNFKKIIVVLNVGGMVDSTWFKEDDAVNSVLMAWQGGMEGGLAAADILCGDVNPSGKLTDTFAASLEDYPSTENLHEFRSFVEYKDDIFVGYRYFETMEDAFQKVNYPFGYGLSYTEFEICQMGCGYSVNDAYVQVSVTNIGKRAGKEVVQVYGCSSGKTWKTGIGTR